MDSSQNISPNLENKSNQDIEQLKQILREKDEQLQAINNKNINLIRKIEYKKQSRNEIIRKVIDKQIKSAETSAVLLKNVITHCHKEQTKFNRIKHQLMQNPEKVIENLEENDDLIQIIEKAKVSMADSQKQLKTESTDDDKIISKKINIQTFKQQITKLKFENTMTELKTNAINSEIADITSKINVVDLNYNSLQQNIKRGESSGKVVKKIVALKELCEENANNIKYLETISDTLKNKMEGDHVDSKKLLWKIYELNQNITNYVDSMNYVQSEILDLKEKYQKNKKDLEEKMKNLKLDLENKQLKIDEEKKQNEILKQEMLNITSSVKFAKSNNEKLANILFDLKSEAKDKSTYSEEAKLFIKNKISMLDTYAKMQIKNELKLLEDNIAQLKKQHQDELDSYNEIAKPSEKELEVQKLIEIKQDLTEQIEALKQKINEQNVLFDEKNKEVEIKFAGFKEQTRIFINEIARVHEANEQNRREKLAKMREENSALDLELFRLNIKKLNAKEQLKKKVREYNRIQRFMGRQGSDMDIGSSSSQTKRAKLSQAETATNLIAYLTDTSDSDSDNESELENAAAAPKRKEK